MKAHIPKEVRKELDYIMRVDGITKQADAFKNMAQYAKLGLAVRDIRNGMSLNFSKGKK